MGTLSIEDCMCPICMCIFVEPVTMPCTHTLCMPCFKKNVEEASLTCPMCRTRISVWARRASKNRKLVNEKLWIDIQSLFPDKVKKRIDGDDEEESIEVFMHPIINIAQPGEIRKEYEEQLKRLAEQREKEQQKEMEASEALIRKLQEEEEIANRMRKKEQIEIQKLDEEFAKELVNTEGESPVTIEALSRTRISRSASSCSSVSATSSRPASTIDTFLSKMREAERLKEKDRGCMSPYPYGCISPKDKDLTHGNSNNSSELNERCTSVISLSSSDTDLKEQTLDYGYIGIDAELRKKTGGHSKGNTNKNKTETVGNPQAVSTMSRSSSTTSVCAENENTKTASQTRSSSTQSNDSISQELIHFRPIKLCPLTPPKKLASGKVVDPPLIRTTPKNLNKTSLSSPERSLSDIDASSPIMQRRLSELSEERKEMVEKLSKSTGTSEGEVKSRNMQTSSFEEVKKENSENSTKVDKTLSTTSAVENKNRIYDRKTANVSQVENKVPIKRLIIPLEANLHEEDEFDPMTPLVEINNINKTRSPLTQTGKLSLKDKNDNDMYSKGKSSTTNVKRKKGNHRLNVTHKKESGSEILSPQRSIIDYLRGDYSSGDCGSTSKIIRETNKTLSYGRDEVDGTVGSMTTVNVNKCGDGGSVSRELDKGNSTVRINTRQCSPTRKIKRKFDSDYEWADLSVKKKSKGKKNVCDSELDTYNSEGEDILDTSSDISSFSKDEDVTHKKQNRVNTRHLDNFVKKTKRVLSETDTIKSASRAPKRRKIENQLGEEKVQKRKTLKTSKHKKKIQNNAKVKTKKQKGEKTVKSFFSTLSNTDNMTDNTDVLDQEYLDQQLALKLERQFQIEAKMRMSALRFKGTEGQYNFRSKPKYVSS